MRLYDFIHLLPFRLKIGTLSMEESVIVFSGGKQSAVCTKTGERVENEVSLGKNMQRYFIFEKALGNKLPSLCLSLYL